MEEDRTQSLIERVAHLEEVVRELARGQAAGPTEVTANRLAIVDEAGLERIVLETVDRTASVLVRVPGPQGATTGIELYASPAEDGNEPSVGLCVLRGGDVEGTWTPG